MNKLKQVKGRCVCGGVKILAEEVDQNVGACHCSICRNWGGGPLMAVDCGTEVKFEGEDNITSYDSSDWAERGFCKQCGTHLYYRLKQTKQHIMPAGLFEVDSFIFDHQIFVDEQPKYYCFSNKTKNMTGAEVFAAYS